MCRFVRNSTLLTYSPMLYLALRLTRIYGIKFKIYIHILPGIRSSILSGILPDILGIIWTYLKRTHTHTRTHNIYIHTISGILSDVLCFQWFPCFFFSGSLFSIIPSTSLQDIIVWQVLWHRVRIRQCAKSSVRCPLSGGCRGS